MQTVGGEKESSALPHSPASPNLSHLVHHFIVFENEHRGQRGECDRGIICRLIPELAKFKISPPCCVDPKLDANIQCAELQLFTYCSFPQSRGTCSPLSVDAAPPRLHLSLRRGWDLLGLLSVDFSAPAFMNPTKDSVANRLMSQSDAFIVAAPQTGSSSTYWLQTGKKNQKSFKPSSHRSLPSLLR